MKVTLDLILGVVGSVCSCFLQTTLWCDLGIHFFLLLCPLVFSSIKWNTSLPTTGSWIWRMGSSFPWNIYRTLYVYFFFPWVEDPYYLWGPGKVLRHPREKELELSWLSMTSLSDFSLPKWQLSCISGVSVLSKDNWKASCIILLKIIIKKCFCLTFLWLLAAYAAQKPFFCLAGQGLCH